MDTNMLTSLLQIFMCTVSPLWLVWIKAFGMSRVMLCHCSCALLVDCKNNASIEVVGLDDSSFCIQLRCLLPFAHIQALIHPSHFSIRNIKDSRTFLRSKGVRVCTWIGSKHFLECNCPTSDLADCTPFSPNLIILCFKF